MLVLSSLIKDHWLIRRMLSALEVFIRRVEDEGQVPREDLKRFAAFFKVFGDEHHAEKEEEVLLPLLTRAGGDWQDGPLAKARRDHRHERYFMRVMEQLAEQEAEYDQASRSHLVSELRGFVDNMRAHLKMEDEEVFPLARQLPEAEQNALNLSLGRFDASTQSAETYQVQGEVADALLERYRS